jgi:hypothetical protein
MPSPTPQKEIENGGFEDVCEFQRRYPESD